jgi:phage terminase large subunit-like protein
LTWDTSCPDWQERLLSGRPPIPDLPLNRKEADEALRVFKRLHVPDVQGMPTLGEVGAPWFFSIVETIFGAYDPVTHRRAINEVFILVPKKNGKSSNAGALAITTLICNYRPAAEFLFVAPTKMIADIAFRQAALTIKANPRLAAIFHVQSHIRRITHRLTDAMAQIKAADTDAITGGKNTYALIDETHEFAKKPRSADVFLEIRGALAARPDGFLVQLTTQSKEPPVGVFKAELAIARAVRDGELQSPLLPILYELPLRLTRDGGWKERRYWPIINPSLGRSVDAEFLERELMKAERTGQEQLALFASQHFNVEIGLALRSDRWSGADYWLEAAEPDLTLETLLERSEVVTVGIDGGGNDDLLAVAVVGREKETRRWLVWARAFANIRALRLRLSEATAMVDFAHDNDLIVVDAFGPIPPATILGRLAEQDSGLDALDPEAGLHIPPDIAGVVDVCKRVETSGKLAMVGVDPVGLGLIIDGLASIGISEEEEGPSRVAGVSQGFKLMGAIKTAERKLLDGTLRHAGQALMAWAVGNAKIEVKGNGVMITKQLAGTGKIDPLMAMLDAVALMSNNPEADGPSIYNDAKVRPEGFLVV